MPHLSLLSPRTFALTLSAALLLSAPALATAATNTQCQTLDDMPAASTFAPLVERLPAEHPAGPVLESWEARRHQALQACTRGEQPLDDAAFKTLKQRADFFREATAASQRLDHYRERRAELIDQALAEAEISKPTHQRLQDRLRACMEHAYQELPTGEGGAPQYHAWNTPIERCLSTLDLELRDLASAEEGSSWGTFLLLLLVMLGLSGGGIALALLKTRNAEPGDTPPAADG
ncbi:hypothetical protein DL240_07370 [Lujinxingia litoralis]|uniref:Uncharacterized protein n=1 Tax=Lujinxingia litoralis TaxID=2211119 RepID=A0A328C8Z6_9DELT|nr:hypothetical protein [Lujinxingia litoralis]RAL23960.1 hypothetical protein DL240_07370 [Lujinxingia litoralis]